MPFSNDDIAALPSYQDSELLTLYRWALANGAAGTTRSINGRSVTFPTVGEIVNLIGWLEQRIQDDATAQQGTGGNVSVVQFNEKN